MNCSYMVACACIGYIVCDIYRQPPFYLKACNRNDYIKRREAKSRNASPLWILIAELTPSDLKSLSVKLAIHKKNIEI